MKFKVKNTISGLLIIAILAPSFLMFSTPKKVEASGFPVVDAVGNVLSHIGNLFAGTTAAGTTTTAAINVKKVLQDIANELLKVVAKRALANITKSTVNWINSGFHGAPLFVENPDSFFKDIAKSEIKNLISVIGYDPIRFPFGKQQSLSIINTYKSQLETNAAYSLSEVTNDPLLNYNYRVNFGTGGWNGFLLNTQYPQNNPFGFQIVTTKELAINLQGTQQNAAQKINTTLQQGMGFLSPQVCPSNPNYNNLTNPFQKPTFTYKPSAGLEKPPEYQLGQVIGPGSDYQKSLDFYESMVRADKASQEDQWKLTNDCPGGLVTTTPGAVVGNSIMTSLAGGQKLTELQAALGGSLSAVFDAVLNKFLGSGLSSLATKTNTPAQNTDNWDYFGNTLGSSSGDINGNNGDVFNGPDQVVVLSDFKEKIDEGIKNTNIELKLMDNSDPSNYGIAQMLSLIWPKTRELDICTPGPNLGWEARLNEEQERNMTMIQAALAQDSNSENTYKINLAAKNLQYAVNFFRDWIRDQMTIPVTQGGLGLPNSSMFIDAVKEITNISEESAQLTNNRRAKQQALTRLLSIQNSINSFTTDPIAGSQGEKDLISFKKQYDAISFSISNTFTIEDTKAELETAIDRYKNISKLLGQCTQERSAPGIGWSIPAEGWVKAGGENSNLFSAQGKTFRFDSFFGRNLSGWNPLTRKIKVITTTGNEKEQFCDLPIVGGYTHETFINPQDTSQDGRNVAYPAIPLVNAGALSGLASSDTQGKPSAASPFFGAYGPLQNVNMNLSCNIIYQSNILDYKGDAPGTTKTIEPPRLPDVDPNLPINNTGTTDTTNTGNNGGTTTPPPTDCGTDIACG